MGMNDIDPLLREQLPNPGLQAADNIVLIKDWNRRERSWSRSVEPQPVLFLVVNGDRMLAARDLNGFKAQVALPAQNGARNEYPL